MKLLISAVLAVVLPLAATAQPANRSSRDEAFKIIDAYIMSNLQESVGLTSDQYVKLLPLVKKLQDERRAFAQRRFRALGELRQGFREGTITEAQVAERLKELKDVETQEPAALRQQREVVDAQLSPVQQAKFRVMEMEVEQRIRQVMARVRDESGRARPRR